MPDSVLILLLPRMDEGYRNENGQTRQKRRAIGKIAPVTRQTIYKPEYLAQLQSPGMAKSINCTPTSTTARKKPQGSGKTCMQKLRC